MPKKYRIERPITDNLKRPLKVGDQIVILKTYARADFGVVVGSTEKSIRYIEPGYANGARLQHAPEDRVVKIEPHPDVCTSAMSTWMTNNCG